VTALLDTGFLLAVLDGDDDLHEACTNALQNEDAPLLPDFVIPELAYLILRELGYRPLTQFLSAVMNGEFEVERTQMEDLRRTNEILAKYQDSKVDFVDCVIVAMAERLNIPTILTVDQRHFRLFRPKHCSYFIFFPP
jgi:predicted nucleic acid-binding protein